MSDAGEQEVRDRTNEREPATSLVPVDDEGTFLVFGALPEELGLEIDPVPYLLDEQARVFADTLADAAGIGNVLIQGWNAYQGSAGLVRLAPETLAALRAGATPLTRGGWSLGTLTKGGKFAAQVRWAPAGAAGVGAALAAIGPAVALLAVQWQLTKIGRAVERNIALTQTVLDELREEAWYELHSAARIVLDSARQAQAIGEVTELVWGYTQAQSTLAILMKHRQRNLDALTRKLDDLSRSQQASDWYHKNYADVLRHSQAVMTAQQAISMHQLLRVAYARRADAVKGPQLAEAIMRQATQEHDATARQIDGSLKTLHRSLSLWYEADPGKKLTVFERRNVPLLDLRQAVADLHDRATAGPFRNLEPIAKDRAFSAKRALNVSAGDRPGIENRLRWLLEDDEHALLLCRGSYRFGDDEERTLLIVTERRALTVNSKDLQQGRATWREIPTSADLARTVKDGMEQIVIRHDGREGVLKTRVQDQSVYDALKALRPRTEAPSGATSDASP